MRPAHIIALTLAAIALLAPGCGSDDDDPGAEPAPITGEAGEAAERKQKKERKRGSKGEDGGIPPALAANRAQANEILDEGTLERKLEELKGHPIVVNQWGSWCPPCREEFPYFAASAEAHAAEVAFLGIDMQDSRDAAAEFLEENPVPYPSIFDPSAAEIASLGGGIVSPTTVFIDEKGGIVEVFQGAYVSREQLEDDIERHLGVS